jgi:prepilin-type N-terminal cleavage/methylation domain-containing protein
MLQNIKKRQEGFTIIEVMIVLVIAAVILLIVFLAVPALQRNSRNTQKKNIAANLLSASSEYSSNNNGTVPSTAADATTILALVNTNQIITSFSILPIATTVSVGTTQTAPATLSLSIHQRYL